ncbi:copper chaperone [Pelagirhabdus alkalitolerans]|uniref:Copper chaperone CopZ n=1 Tax=Pelagirhabdus alkalitolerans TaxID=1612202 RepID=A0A1G6LPQ1_9BACI|nr:cation transporter [Pelagirhabdus alkalitolerans]SDC45181.1 copper chaperone [Pelagirhabdus alkalitolerans]
MKAVTLNVSGMNCAHCKKSVESSLESFDSVDNISVNLETGHVSFKYDETSTDLNELTEAIEDQGYDVE